MDKILKERRRRIVSEIGRRLRKEKRHVEKLTQAMELGRGRMLVIEFVLAQYSNSRVWEHLSTHSDRQVSPPTTLSTQERIQRQRIERLLKQLRESQ